MSSANPYASASSPRGYDAPKKKRNKWLWIGLPILLLIVIGAVLGGVLGTQLNKDDNNSSGSSSDPSNSGQPANTGVPSGVSDVSTNTQTGANGGRILAIQTDSNLLPVYATGVSRS
jgi:flagellar basal body-associated protein FliL